MTTRLTSPNGEVRIGKNYPTVLINDQLRILDQSPEIFDQLLNLKLDGIIEIARSGCAAGLDMIDILVFHPDLNEVELLPRIAKFIIKEIGCPISLDSRNLEALEAALSEIKPYRALINSVSAERESLEAILPLAKKYDAAVVGMPIGDTYGLPKILSERVFEAQVIVDACEGKGIDRERIIMDGICLASSAEPESFQVTVESIKAFQDDLEVSTILGIGNAGFGMPTPTVIDLAYLVGAIPWGLNSALVNPSTKGLVNTVRAIDFLVNNDFGGKRYINWYRKNKKAKK